MLLCKFVDVAVRTAVAKKRIPALRSCLTRCCALLHRLTDGAVKAAKHRVSHKKPLARPKRKEGKCSYGPTHSFCILA